MQKQCANQDLHSDDSLDQQIRLNEIHKSLALDCAGYFLTESSERLRLNGDLPYTPVIVAAHAIIAHREWQHDIDRDRFKKITDQLVGVKCSIDELNETAQDINESIDCAGAKVTDFWMSSHEAAKDKAREIGLDVPIEWTPADLRYKLHQAIYGGDNG